MFTGPKSRARWSLKLESKFASLGAIFGPSCGVFSHTESQIWLSQLLVASKTNKPLSRFQSKSGAMPFATQRLVDLVGGAFASNGVYLAEPFAEVRELCVIL